MDPMTMMAIANFGMQMLKGSGGQGGGQGGQQQQQPQQPQMQKAPFQPGPIPGNNTDYGSIIKAMMDKQNPQPGMAMPGMTQ